MKVKRKQKRPSSREIPEGSKSPGPDRTLDVNAAVVALQLPPDALARAGVVMCRIGAVLSSCGMLLLGRGSVNVAEELAEAPRPLPDDAYVHQDDAPVSREIFLRLARERAFPSRRLGHKIIAQVGDVRRALAPDQDIQREGRGGHVELLDPKVEALDKLRAELSFQRK